MVPIHDFSTRVVKKIVLSDVADDGQSKDGQ